METMRPIQAKKCNQCLFSKNKIVSEERKAEVLKSCDDDGTYFVCHKSKSACCYGFALTMAPLKSLIEMQKAGLVKFVKDGI